MHRLAISCLSVVLAAAAATAGPAAPSAGTPLEVEQRIAIGTRTTPGDATAVYIITRPGSYYLTGNIIAPSGQSAIRINAAGVTIDLNGSLIIGTPGSLAGVEIAADAAGVTVRNGHIRFMAGAGIDAEGARSLTVERVDIRGSGGHGIIAGDDAAVRDVRADSCGAAGIQLGRRAMIERSTVDDLPAQRTPAGAAPTASQGIATALLFTATSPWMDLTH